MDDRCLVLLLLEIDFASVEEDSIENILGSMLEDLTGEKGRMLENPEKSFLESCKYWMEDLRCLEAEVLRARWFCSRSAALSLAFFRGDRLLLLLLRPDGEAIGDAPGAPKVAMNLGDQITSPKRRCRF